MVEEKVTFSQDIPIRTAEKFHAIAEQLPGLKWECLQAMILVFANLPRYAQVQAIDGNYDVRELLRVTDLIEGQEAARKAADADVPLHPPKTRKNPQ